jgi:hypothetical protein
VQKVRWLRLLCAGRRGSSLVYMGWLEDRLADNTKGGGGKISDREVEEQVLRTNLRQLGYVPRPLLAPWGVWHTDGAQAYRALHRETGTDTYRALGYWHTWVRHSRKKNPETGKMMPVQFCVRKKIKVKNGATEWRKGGTQKKDGFFALLRRLVSRRACTTVNRRTLRGMLYFFQWQYWRTRDPEQDALRGHHDKKQAPLFDLLFELGQLRKRLREKLGDEALMDDKWLEKAETTIFRDLPLERSARRHSDGWTDGQSDTQTDGQTGRQTDRPTHRRTDGQSDTQTDGQTGRQTDRQTGGRTAGQTNRPTDRQREGQTDGQTDRRTAGWRASVHDLCRSLVLGL